MTLRLAAAAGRVNVKREIRRHLRRLIAGGMRLREPLARLPGTLTTSHLREEATGITVR